MHRASHRISIGPEAIGQLATEPLEAAIKLLDQTKLGGHNSGETRLAITGGGK